MQCKVRVTVARSIYSGRHAHHFCLAVVEDFPRGYPQYSALIGSHPSFHVYRRFSSLRARLLLLQQDKLSVLEKKLADVDQAEPRKLFLGSLRADVNQQRSELMREINVALREYGEFRFIPCTDFWAHLYHMNSFSSRSSVSFIAGILRSRNRDLTRLITPIY